MEIIEECSSPSSYYSLASAKLLVGISLNPQNSSDLLSWVVRVAAGSNDTVVALHVIVGKEEKRLTSNMTRFRQAKSFVISMLGEFAEICQTKHIKLEAKVIRSSSIGRGLTGEAALLEANFLIVGGPSKSSHRSSFEIMKYCFKHVPVGCSVIAIGTQSHPHHDTDKESMTYEGNHSSSSRWRIEDRESGKTRTALQKLLGSKTNRDKTHSLSESISEESSPVAVLDGPEEASEELEESFSLRSSKSKSIGHSRRNTWRRLSIVKLFYPFFRSKDSLSESDHSSSTYEDQRPSWRCFTYEEISHATNNFHLDNLVGRGGYAEVYRGELYDGQTIAVKRLAKGTTDENKEKEFLTELGIIGHVFHPNTAFLLGCCIESGLHLIFEFSPNGSLASALHGRNSKLLEWPVRYRIAVGIAQGLHYLHKCCRRRIIHRDIKASNVLLGADFEPQISDFGLAKWLPRQWTHHCVIPIEGTFGYLAPEYFMHGIVDEKTDVFAFGVLLLEIVTGRRPIDSSKQSLLLWARPIIESGKLEELADPKLLGNYDVDQLQQLVLIASYCVRQSSIWRPSMTEVLQLLTDGSDPKIAESCRMTEIGDEVDDDDSIMSDFYGPC